MKKGSWSHEHFESIQSAPLNWISQEIISTFGYIVIVPEDITTLATSDSPPKFVRDSDKFSWREEVTEWGEKVGASAHAGDNRAKVVAASLSHTLYHSRTSDKRELVKLGLRTGEIILTPSSNILRSNKLQFVEKIIQLVAKNTPVEFASRSYVLYNKINVFVRNSGESISAYVSRFTAIAEKYLNLIQESEMSTESQNFAMTILSNEKISEQTFSAIFASLDHRQIEEGRNYASSDLQHLPCQFCPARDAIRTWWISS